MHQVLSSFRRSWRRRDPALRFGLLMVLFMWAGTTLEVRREFASANQSMFRDTSNHARVLEGSVLRSLKQIDTQLWFVSLQAGRTMPDSWSTILEDLPLDSELTIQIALIDRTGLVRASTSPNLSTAPVNLSDREHVRVHLDRKIEGLFVSKPVIGRLSKRWSIQLSRAIMDRAGTVVGVAVASLDPAHISRLYENMGLSSSGSALLFGTDGIVRAGAGSTAALVGEDISAWRVAGTASSIPDGNLVAPLRPGSDAMITSWRRIAGFDLAVVVAQASSPDLRDARTWSALLVALALLFTAIIGALSWRMSAASQRLMLSEMRLRRTRRQIEGQSTWLKLTLENVSQGIAMTDPSGRVVVSNRKLQQLMNDAGCGPESCDHGMLGRIIAESRTNHRDDDGKPHAATHTLGAGTILKTVSVALPNRGLVVTFEDITESDRHERQLLAAEQAAQAGNRAKSMFLASMSHELRTPMNGVIGMAQVLLETEEDTERRRQLETIIASGEALTSIINDVLDYSRLEAGRLELRPVRFNLRKTLDELTTLLSARAAERGLDIAARYQPDLPGWFIGDVGRFKQIVTNLLGNAVKFTTGRNITIDVGGAARGSHFDVSVAVTDFGPGIPPDKITAIFEDFTQLDNPADSVNSGTGLGLPICRRLARLMGGHVNVVSQVGQGSTFTLTIPLAIAAKIERADSGADLQHLLREASARLAAGRRIKVLAAEDNKANRQVLVSMLKTENVDVVLACDGREAVDRFLDVSPDVVLMDLKMPHVDGVEATSRIRALEQDQGRTRTPIIAISANAMRGDLQKCLDQGMDDYMSKPIQKTCLVRMLDKWTGNWTAAERSAIMPWCASDRRGGHHATADHVPINAAAE